jgi:hypothetical protein
VDGGQQRVEHADLVPRCPAGGTDGRADEPGTAGDEDAHEDRR